jgi:hypothetical protein
MLIDTPLTKLDRSEARKSPSRSRDGGGGHGRGPATTLLPLASSRQFTVDVLLIGSHFAQVSTVPWIEARPRWRWL